VTVRVYSGPKTSGILMQTLSASFVTGTDSVAASPALADGQYTAQARQSDSAGNTGFSSANTFTVSTVGPLGHFLALLRAPRLPAARSASR
jgi:hypothetical protein